MALGQSLGTAVQRRRYHAFIGKTRRGKAFSIEALPADISVSIQVIDFDRIIACKRCPDLLRS